MEKSEYEAVSNCDESGLKTKCNNNVTWKPFLRQLLICSAAWTTLFLYGLFVSAPTVFIPQIRKEANDTNIITKDMASWLSFVYNFSGFPFVIIISIFTRLVGRKIPFIVAVLVTFAAFTILYYSSNVTHLLISEIMQGFFSASQTAVTLLIVTEYISPKYRGIFLTIKSSIFYWGIWCSNAIGTFFHWRWIPLVGMACALYALLTVIVWPESPYWLASRGRFEECAAAHRWVKGCDEQSEIELEVLINSQKEYLASCGNRKMSTTGRITDFFKTLKSREFYKPTLLACLTAFLTISTGKLVFAVYAIDIIKKITVSESLAYIGMLILDGITVLSMYVGCALSRYLKRRSMLLVASAIGVVFQFILSLYLYLIKLNVIVENKYVSLLLLSAYSIAVCCGPILMSMSVYGELIPVKSRMLSACVVALAGKFSIGIFLKLSPLLFKIFGLHGTFLSFGICSSTVIFILYKYLPETKDKTLQEIENNMVGSKSKNIREASDLLNK